MHLISQHGFSASLRGAELLVLVACVFWAGCAPPEESTKVPSTRVAPPKSELQLTLNADTSTVMVSDSVMLSVWGYPDFATRSVVKPTGTITIPLVGEQLAAGYKREELIQLVRQRLSEYVKGDIKISLDVIRPAARIMVLGSVSRPGSFPSNIDLPLLEVLASVGGWTQDADLRYVRINRAAVPSSDGVTFEVDVEDALERGTVRSLPMIHPGDAVVVPRSSNFVREFGDFFRDAILVLGLIGLTR